MSQTTSRSRWITWTAAPPALWALALLGLGACLWAQRLIDQRLTLPLAVGLFAAGLVVFLLGTGTGPLERRAQGREVGQALSRPLLAWGLVLALLAFVSVGDNRFRIHGALAWVLAMVAMVAAMPSGSRSGLATAIERYRRERRLILSWAALAGFAALAAGAFLRLYRLLELPADLGWDLPYNYTDIERVLRGEWLVFFPDNFGREGMFFYLGTAVAKLMGLSPYSIRVTSALIGIATVAAVYGLAHECCGRSTAVIATWLLALNRWHITLSRSGYRVSLMPLFSVLLLWGLARALRRGSGRDWAWAGLALGLGLWTYKSFLFALPLAIGIVLWYALITPLGGRRGEGVVWSQGRRRALLRGLGLMLLVALVAVVPLLRFVIDSPQVYLARELQGIRLVDSSLEEGGVSRWALYGRNLLTSLGMWNYEGDANSRFGLPFQRHMGLVSAVLFALGVGLMLIRLRRGGNALLLLGVLGLMAPMTISMLAGEKPNCFRSSGVIGPSCLLAAMAANRLVTRTLEALASLRRGRSVSEECARPLLRWSAPWVLAMVLLLALLAAEGYDSYHTYFHRFADQAPDEANFSLALAVAETIIAYEDGPAYVRAWPYWIDDRALNAHLATEGRSHAGQLQRIAEGEPPLDDYSGPMLIVLPGEDTADLQLLQQLLPRAFVKTVPYPSGRPAIYAVYSE